MNHNLLFDNDCSILKLCPLGSASNEIGGISSQSGANTSQPSAPGQGRTPAHRQQQYQPTISTADPMGLTHVSISF